MSHFGAPLVGAAATFKAPEGVFDSMYLYDRDDNPVVCTVRRDLRGEVDQLTIGTRAFEVSQDELAEAAGGVLRAAAASAYAAHCAVERPVSVLQPRTQATYGVRPPGVSSVAQWLSDSKCAALVNAVLLSITACVVYVGSPEVESIRQRYAMYKMASTLCASELRRTVIATVIAWIPFCEVPNPCVMLTTFNHAVIRGVVGAVCGAAVAHEVGVGEQLRALFKAPLTLRRRLIETVCTSMACAAR